MRGIFYPQGGLGLSAGITEKFIIFLYFWSYHSCYRLHFVIKVCIIKFFTELNTFQMDDKDLPTNNIREKSTQIFKINYAPVHHLPSKVLNSHCTPDPNKQCKYRGNLLQKEENNYTAYLPGYGSHLCFRASAKNPKISYTNKIQLIHVMPHHKN